MAELRLDGRVAIVTGAGQGLGRQHALELVTPVVAWLAHESNDISGETYSVGAGRVARVFVAEGPGYTSKDGLTVEDVRDSWRQINETEPYLLAKNIGEQMAATFEAIK